MKKYDISLRIFEENLDPQVITKDLQIVPDHQHKKGEFHTMRSKRGKEIGRAYYKQGMWSKEFAPAANDFQADLRRIGRELEIYKEIFSEYKEKGYHMDLFCGLWYETGESKTIIDEEIVRILSNIHIAVELDEYWL